MNRTGSYREDVGREVSQKDRSSTMGDIEAWVGNSLALILVGLAIAAGVIGMLVAFEYINDGAANPFQDGMIWLVSALVLAICANAFRREHHITDYR
jgi:hypothetical protein